MDVMPSYELMYRLAFRTHDGDTTKRRNQLKFVPKRLASGNRFRPYTPGLDRPHCDSFSVLACLILIPMS